MGDLKPSKGVIFSIDDLVFSCFIEYNKNAVSVSLTDRRLINGRFASMSLTDMRLISGRLVSICV